MMKEPRIDLEEQKDNSPEKQLILNVILRAISDVACVRRSDRCSGKAMLDAMQWIESDVIEPFSFLWCLDAINATGAATTIRKLAKGLSENAPQKNKRFTMRSGFSVELKRIKAANMSKHIREV